MWALPQRADLCEHLVGHRLMTLARRAPVARRHEVTPRRAVGDSDTGELESFPVARPLGSSNRHGHHGRAALQRQPPNPGTRRRRHPRRSRAAALGIENNHATAPENLKRRGDRLLVVMAATHGERTRVGQDRAQRTDEQL